MNTIPCVMNSELLYLKKKKVLSKSIFSILDCKQFQGKNLYFTLHLLCGIMHKSLLGLIFTFWNMWQILHMW